jgi:ATP-dependent helicase/nuclease subunit B
MNQSPFFLHIKKLFPKIEFTRNQHAADWREGEHTCELAAPLLNHPQRSGVMAQTDFKRLAGLPELRRLQEQVAHFTGTPPDENIPKQLAERLYGTALHTSVSRMEQFAACPFKFFVHSGLRAEERKSFEVDDREEGNFQHEILMWFHEELSREGKRWRDVTPEEARALVASIGKTLATTFRDGLMLSTDQARFSAHVLTTVVQDFVEVLVGWMRGQYAFDPVRVEVAFGGEKAVLPAWRLDLDGKHQLLLRGRIDRIDLYREPGKDEALCVVVDYKSSQKKLEAVMMENGLQLQLPAYLGVLRHLSDSTKDFGVKRLIPAGVFYVNLRGQFDSGSNRDAALEDISSARREAYQHSGRFDRGVLDKLDERKGVKKGDQFNYIKKLDGEVAANSKEPMKSDEFFALLDQTEATLKKMGRDIYAGVTKVDPYRRGTTTACDICEYQSICRIDPWRHVFRVLGRTLEEKTS